ncbi:MAG: 4Fe-4S dicluster domain-containing protein [Candidatus Odinarchaeota archaeon]
MEGWGFPKRDPETCIGCYSCYNICPEGVITLEEVNDKRIYGSLSHNCVHCRECEKACPTEALTVVSGFELMSFLKGTSREDITHQMLACSECGEFFASVKHVEYTEQKVAASGVKKVMDIPEGHLHICPACKRKQIASGLLQTSIRQTALFTSRRT